MTEASASRGAPTPASARARARRSARWARRSASRRTHDRRPRRRRERLLGVQQLAPRTSLSSKAECMHSRSVAPSSSTAPAPKPAPSRRPRRATAAALLDWRAAAGRLRSARRRADGVRSAASASGRRPVVDRERAARHSVRAARRKRLDGIHPPAGASSVVVVERRRPHAAPAAASRRNDAAVGARARRRRRRPPPPRRSALVVVVIVVGRDLDRRVIRRHGRLAVLIAGSIASSTLCHTVTKVRRRRPRDRPPARRR